MKARFTFILNTKVLRKALKIQDRIQQTVKPSDINFTHVKKHYEGTKVHANAAFDTLGQYLLTLDKISYIWTISPGDLCGHTSLSRIVGVQWVSVDLDKLSLDI